MKEMLDHLRDHKDIPVGWEFRNVDKSGRVCESKHRSSDIE